MKKHPITKDHIRVFIATYSFKRLLFYYLVFCVGLSLFFGSIYYFNELAPGKSYFEHISISFFELFGADVFEIRLDTTNTVNIVIFLIHKILAILIPGIILGTIIFKLLLHPEILTFKESLNLYYDTSRKKHFLCIRFYSATNLNLTSLEFKVIVRLKRIREKNGAPYLINRTIQCDKRWDFAIPKVPRTIFIELDARDLNTDKGEDTLSIISIQGEKCSYDDELWVLIKGDIPQLGNSFTERKTYSIGKDIKRFRWSDIHVDYNQKPTSWLGWDTFED
ncbi:hypothetical protein [Ascidiimonas aurantiaca]|uniref:hypothetical protein n=1 Tax=Ascidiimonas aurantiaca TaxID=1685432 RepID=UPI0030EC5B09